MDFDAYRDHQLHEHLRELNQDDTEETMYNEQEEERPPHYCEGCGSELEEEERIRPSGKWVCAFCGSDQIVENY